MTNIKGQQQQLLTELIQAQMVILGPSVGLDAARQINGLQIDESGNVLALLADSQQILNKLNRLYNEISPHTTNNTMLTLLTQYPDIQKPVL